MKKLLNSLLPAGSFRRRIAKKVLTAFGLLPKHRFDYYNTLAQQNREYIQFHLAEEDISRCEILISIVTPMFNTPSRYLYPFIYSVVSQSYENWELILVNASTDKKSRDHINSCTAIDHRIKVIEADNKGISSNTNIGIVHTSGDYIAFSDHDDVLAEHALYEVVKAIIKNPEVDLLYSDEDKLSEDGQQYLSPHFKPDWSPDLLTRVNYITHLVVIKKTIIDKVGLLDPSKDGAQDYDFLLRIADTQPVIIHIPKILYHWRLAASSTAKDFLLKPNITDAGKLALEEHFMRINVKAEVEPKKNRPGYYNVKYEPLRIVSIIITPFTNDKILNQFIKLLVKRTDQSVSYNLIIPQQANLQTDDVPITHIPTTSRQYLKDALERAGKYAVVINQVMFPKKKNWLEELSGIIRLKHVAAVAPVVVNKDNVIEDMGLIEAQGELRPLFKNAVVGNNLSFFGTTEWERNISELRGSVTLLRTAQLLDYIAENDTLSSRSVIREFTKQQFKRGLYNTILPTVKFTRESLNIYEAAIPARDMFNINLVDTGPSTELKTPDTAALNILMLLNEADYVEDEDEEE